VSLTVTLIYLGGAVAVFIFSLWVDKREYELIIRPASKAASFQ
jgi:hypothetical protein